jgi:hypothetical protein
MRGVDYSLVLCLVYESLAELEGWRPDMNALDRVLRDDLNRLLDRIAASTRAGVAKASERHLPDLRLRLDEAEGRLSTKRQQLLEHYREWQEMLETCEDLWAVAQLELEQTAGGGTRRAA